MATYTTDPVACGAPDSSLALDETAVVGPTNNCVPLPPEIVQAVLDLGSFSVYAS